MVCAIGALLDSVILLLWENIPLVDLHVHLLDEEAVSWNAITLLEKHNVTNDDFCERDLGRDSILASDNCRILCLNLSVQVTELALFAEVADSRNCGHEENSNVDRYTRNPAICFVCEERHNEGEGGNNQEQPDEVIIE